MQRVDRILARRYHLQTADRQDAIAEALLACVTAGGAIRVDMDGFFLVIACRRACDFWRRKSRETALTKKVALPEPGKGFEERLLLEEIAQHFFAAKPTLEKSRALRVIRKILAGAGFSEACRTTGIPRGSRRRYRSALQSCFQNVLHSSPGPDASCDCASANRE